MKRFVFLFSFFYILSFAVAISFSMLANLITYKLLCTFIVQNLNILNTETTVNIVSKMYFT